MHRRSLVTLGCIVVALPPAVAQEDFSSVVGAFSRERSLAEDAASIMKRYAPEDINGHILYSQAKAAFDQMIEQLLSDLAQGKAPNISTPFHAKMQMAVDRRIAFSQRVTAVIKDRVPSGSKGTILNLLALGGGPGELVEKLTSSAKMIWQEWRTASNERRIRLEKRLEAQRWKAFSEIS